MSDVEGVAQDQLRSFVERIERIRESIKEQKDDEKDVFAEAKAMGFNVPVLRKILADRAKDENERSEFEAVYELYAQALGMQPSLFDEAV